MNLFSIRNGVTGRHVLLWLSGFFGLMFVANGIFLYYALTTFNGLESPNAYNKGLRYNETIAADRAQRALGWSHRLTLLPAADGLRAAIANNHGAPVTGLVLKGTIGRPVADREDRAIDFAEVRPGEYEARFPALATGAWVTAVTAHQRRDPAKPLYRVKERLWVNPPQ